jgi:phage gp45-like
MDGMNEILNSMRFQANIGSNFSSHPRIGIVTSYNPSDCTVKVRIQPEDADNPENSLSGDIPLATNFIGLVGAPNIGDQVIVVFQEGSFNNGIVIGSLYSDEDIPPQAVEAGEYKILHKSGSLIYIKNNGDIQIQAANNVNIIGNSTGNIKAPQINLSNGGAVMRLITEALVEIFNMHTHGGGAPPDMQYQIGSEQLTSVTKAE